MIGQTELNYVLSKISSSSVHSHKDVTIITPSCNKISPISDKASLLDISVCVTMATVALLVVVRHALSMYLPLGQLLPLHGDTILSS